MGGAYMDQVGTGWVSMGLERCVSVEVGAVNLCLVELVVVDKYLVELLVVDGNVCSVGMGFEHVGVVDVC